jgi:hypothetical protein
VSLFLQFVSTVGWQLQKRFSSLNHSKKINLTQFMCHMTTIVSPIPNMIEDGRNTETRGCVTSFCRGLGLGGLGLGWDGIGGWGWCYDVTSCWVEAARPAWCQRGLCSIPRRWRSVLSKVGQYKLGTTFKQNVSSIWIFKFIKSLDSGQIMKQANLSYRNFLL